MEKYGFDKSWTEEQRRLGLIERCYDQATTARLARLGVSPGWKCLEVGAGNGSISRWMRDRVAPSGRVVALDLDTRFIDEEPGIEVRRGDILVDDVESDAYDLVFCRAVLHHVVGRQVDALRKMASALRPGGVLLAEEPWLGAVLASRTPAYARAWGALDDAMPADYGWAVTLPTALQEAGLVEIETCGEAVIVRGGTPEAELYRLTIEAVRARVPTDVDIDSGLKVLLDPSAFEPGVVWYSAWGRREIA